MKKKLVIKEIICLILLFALCACVPKRKKYRDRDEEEQTENGDDITEGIDSATTDEDIETFIDKEGNLTVRRVPGAKPDEKSMVYDLIGHTVSEGCTEGYHPKDWFYKIEKGDIQKLTIDEVITDDEHQYVTVISMQLVPYSNTKNTNFYYDTTAKVRYVKDNYGVWNLDYISSLGMDIVSDGQYDDMVSAKIDQDGWGGTKCVYFTNLSEVTLIVGGRVYADGVWHKYSTRISPYETNSVGGLFGGGSVSECKIDFIIREG